MEIIKSKETLVLTQVENAILLKAQKILDEIYEKSENEGDMEYYANNAREAIDNLVADAEVDGGEPKGAINVTIVI